MGKTQLSSGQIRPAYRYRSQNDLQKDVTPTAACRQKRRSYHHGSRAPKGPSGSQAPPQRQLQLQRVIARWSRYDLIAIDEVGYFVAERAEKAAIS